MIFLLIPYDCVAPDPYIVDARFILKVDPYTICNCAFFGFILLLSVVYAFLKVFTMCISNIQINFVIIISLQIFFQVFCG